MAGIEQVIIHSKSYLIRWISVPEGNSISWSVQPQKRSINFGIVKHPGTKNVSSLTTTQEELDATVPPTPTGDAPPKRGSISRHDSAAVIEKLQGIGMKAVAWQGNCEGDKVTMGKYDVGPGAGGMYGLVFDNTFSKQTGKTVTFVLLIHPTNAPPKSGHHLHYAQAFSSNSNGSIRPSAASFAGSSESLPNDASAQRGVIADPRPASKGHGVEVKGVEGSTFYTGTLQKKRRKRGQGYAKRFFSLDFTSSTLSYYQNRHSSALRGAIPLSLAAIGANEKSREFSVDSGAEVWHLRASNSKDFEGWREALERASSSGVVPQGIDPTSNVSSLTPIAPYNPADTFEWARLEQLVSKVAGTRDAVRALVKDTEIPTPELNEHVLLSPAADESTNPYFPKTDAPSEKRPFWKRKASSTLRTPGTTDRRASAVSASMPVSPIGSSPNISRLPASSDVHERCTALLRDLDSAVASFSALIAESKARRMPTIHVTASRASFESTVSQQEEFFDAEDPGSQLLNIRRSSEYEDGRESQIDDFVSVADSDASSDSGESGIFSTTPKDRRSVMFPAVPQALPPLPLPPIKRRTTITPPKQAPPSIIGFLRKNAGKDLSTVTMPVTANEPTSLLQRLAEGLEYTHLLDSAAGAPERSERLMYVAAFAISGFAYNRVKERALRKPFNPMLGETYELVREDLGYRFLAEKVSHHPVVTAYQADSLTNGGWSFAQSPQPVQKFWGKSVELNTEGRARVVLHACSEGGELYTWSQATCFLRNVIAGEKYVEPVQTMTIVHEASGAKAVATFKTGGMFSGRSEEVNVAFYEPGSGDEPSSIGLSGKWTEALRRTDTNEVIWKAGQLVPDASKVYGFTTFAAALNEITSNEQGSLPPTDSRLRPDQRALEGGDIDKAEALKAKLEERQRSRRKVLEGHGQKWSPQFFERVEGSEEEMWRLKEGRGYWDRRANKDWKGVTEVFET